MVELVSTQGFVLAGGRSRRMGRDKALLDWQGQTLLEPWSTCFHPLSSGFRWSAATPCPTGSPNRGPLGGIATALEVSDSIRSRGRRRPASFDGRFSESICASRLKAPAGTSWRAGLGDRFPLCLGVRKTARDELNRRLETGDWSVRGFVMSADPEIIEAGQLPEPAFDTSIFQNLNTEEDYWKLRT